MRFSVKGVLALLCALAAGCGAARTGEDGRVRFALCQTAPRRGDAAENARRALETAEKAVRGGARVVVFPEFSFVAVEDLLAGAEVPNFEEAPWGLEAFGEWTRRQGCWVVVNHPRREAGRGGRRWNETLVVGPKGRVEAVYRKCVLAMVDEWLGMDAGERGTVAEMAGLRVGLMVCKDTSAAGKFADGYEEADALVVQFAHVLLDEERPKRQHPWPFVKHPEPLGALVARCRDALGKPLLLVDQTGRGPEWRLAGGSRAVDGDGRTVAEAGEEEGVLLVDWVPGAEGGGKWVAVAGEGKSREE